MRSVSRLSLAAARCALSPDRRRYGTEDRKALALPNEPGCGVLSAIVVELWLFQNLNKSS